MNTGFGPVGFTRKEADSKGSGAQGAAGPWCHFQNVELFAFDSLQQMLCFGGKSLNIFSFSKVKFNFRLFFHQEQSAHTQTHTHAHTHTNTHTHIHTQTHTHIHTRIRPQNPYMCTPRDLETLPQSPAAAEADPERFPGAPNLSGKGTIREPRFSTKAGKRAWEAALQCFHAC